MSNRAESWWIAIVALAGAVAGCGPEVHLDAGASGTDEAGTGGQAGTGGATQGTGGTGTSSGGAVTGTDWVHTWGGQWKDVVRDVAIDASGNIYAVGDTESFKLSSPDVMLLKYDAAGTLVWAKTWGVDTLADCRGAGVAISPDGGVYVVGSIEMDPYFGDVDVLVLRYDADGNLEFAKIWGYSSYHVTAADIAIAADGSLYVAGQIGSALFAPQCVYPCTGALLVKLDASAEPVWVRAWVHDQLSGTAGVAVAPDGKVLVSGVAKTSAGPSYHMFTAFDEAGTLLWDRTDKPTSVNPTGARLALDAQGGAYVAFPGADHSTGKFYVHMHAYDPSGQPLWARRWHTPGVDVASDYLYVHRPVVAAGSILVTAWSYKTWDFPYSMLVAFGTDGSDVGAVTWSGPGSEAFQAIAPAAGGRLVLAGSGSSIAGSFAPAVPAFEDWTPEGGAPAPFVQNLVGGVAIAPGTEGSPAATIDAPTSYDQDALILQQLSPFGTPP